MKRCMQALLVTWLVSALWGQQQLDPITKWATIAEYEDHFSFNVIYQKANNVDLRLDVITTGSPSVPRPTLIYFHGGGWLEGTKESTLLYMLPYLARGMNTVNVEYRMAPESLAPAAVEDTRCALALGLRPRRRVRLRYFKDRAFRPFCRRAPSANHRHAGPECRLRQRLPAALQRVATKHNSKCESSSDREFLRSYRSLQAHCRPNYEKLRRAMVWEPAEPRRGSKTGFANHLRSSWFAAHPHHHGRQRSDCSICPGSEPA